MVTRHAHHERENMSKMELAGLTAHEARTLLDGGEVTSVELTTAVLERISQVEDSVKAFVTVTDELAMRQAEQADTRIAAGDVQPLTGVPMVLEGQYGDQGCANYLLVAHAGELCATL